MHRNSAEEKSNKYKSMKNKTKEMVLRVMREKASVALSE